MADFAELGFVAKTAPLVEAAAAINAVVPAAKAADAVTTKLNSTLTQTGNAATLAAAGIYRNKAAWETYEETSARIGIITNKNGAAMNAASGVTKSYSQALNDNAKAATASGAAVAVAAGETIGFRAALMAFISPMGIMITIFSLVAEFIMKIISSLSKLVPWLQIAKSALNEIADVLPKVAIYAAAAGVVLAIAFGPEILAAIGLLIATIDVLTVSAIGGLIATIGIVPLAIVAAVLAFIAFGDYLNKLFGIDIIGYVKKGVNLIIGSFVGAYHDIVAYWSNFPNIIGAAAIGAANLAITATNAIIKAAIGGLNILISSINAVLTVGGIGKKLGMGDPIATIDENAGQFKTIANTAADELATAVADRNAQLQKDLTTDYVGAIGGAIASAANGAAGMIKGFSDGLHEKVPKGRKGPKTDAQKFDDIVNGAERSIAALQAERDAIGQSEEATARLKYETQLLNEAKQKNIDLSPTQRTHLIALADSMAALEVNTKRVQEAFGFAKDLVKGFFSDFEQGIANGEGFWKSFGDAALNALNKIVDKLLNDVIDALFQVNSAAVSGGSGAGGFLSSLVGVFGSLFGGGASAQPAIVGGDPWAGMRMAQGGVFDNGILKFASGGIVNSPTTFGLNGGKTGVMGEAGPETIMPVKRMGNGDMGVAATLPRGLMGSGAANNNQPTEMNININLTGVSGDKQIQDAVETGVTAGLEHFNNHVLPERVNQIANDGRVR